MSDRRIELSSVDYEAIRSPAGADSDDYMRDAVTHVSPQDKALFRKDRYEIDSLTDMIKMEYFSLGFTAGAALQMLVVTFLLMFIASYHDVGPLNELSKEYYPLFRMIFFILWFWILYGVNVFIWKRYGLAGAYYRIYGLNPESHTYQFILRSAASIAYIVFTCFVSYTLILSGLLGDSSGNLKHVFPALSLVIPFTLYFTTSNRLTRFCFGTEDDHASQRYGLIKEFGYVLAAPFVTCTPLRSLIGDILCSMPKVFLDLSYSICLYSDFTDLESGARQCVQGPLAATSSERYWYLTLMMSMIPYIIRTLQTLRTYVDKGGSTNLWNALKYTLSVVVTLLNTVKVNSPLGSTQKDQMTMAWAVVAAGTTAFSYWWDVKMGWGLLNTDSKNFLLRDELTYPKSWYYTAMFANLLMRLVWAFNISPGQPYVAQNVILLFGCLELVRRFVWLAFRVEWIILGRK